MRGKWGTGRKKGPTFFGTGAALEEERTGANRG